MITVKITNDYSDGHHSASEVQVPPPEGDLDEWFQDYVYQWTGDGHGAENDVGACYTAEIIAADDELLLGQTYEWID